MVQSDISIGSFSSKPERCYHWAIVVKYEVLSPVSKDEALLPINKDEALSPVNKDEALSPINSLKMHTFVLVNKDEALSPINAPEMHTSALVLKTLTFASAYMCLGTSDSACLQEHTEHELCTHPR